MTTDHESVEALAAFIGAAGLGKWSPSVPYEEGDFGVYLGPIPAQATAGGIGIIRYAIDRDDYALGRMVQVAIRTPTAAATMELGDKLFTLLHMCRTVPGVAQVKRMSLGSYVSDAGAVETHNYLVTFAR